MTTPAEISRRLREYASDIDRGDITPTAFLLIVSTVVAVGGISGDASQLAAIDRITEEYNNHLKPA